MSRIWKEPRKRVLFGSNDEVFSPMWGGGPPADISPDPKLIPEWVYCVYVCGFTFKFWSVDQIQAALDFYSKKIHPSSRISDSNSYVWCHHREAQRWYERLPLYLRKEGKRQRVVKALEQALQQFSNEKPLIKKALKASDLPVIYSRPYSKSDDFYSVAWCKKCQKLLGQGLCKQCKKSRLHSGYRIAHCNNCNVPFGQGLCKGCETMRKKLVEV
jgi:hypothetical protein